MGSRYAQALFDLASDAKQVAAVEAGPKSLKTALAEKATTCGSLVGSPAFNAEAKGKGLAAIAIKAKFATTTQKFLGLLAANGRADLLASVITSGGAVGQGARGRRLRPGDHRRGAPAPCPGQGRGRGAAPGAGQGP